jgi:hypothetical protein
MIYFAYEVPYVQYVELYCTIYKKTKYLVREFLYRDLAVNSKLKVPLLPELIEDYYMYERCKFS